MMHQPHCSASKVRDNWLVQIPSWLVKCFAMNLLCVIGGHRWSQWAYKSSMDCTCVRVCDRCHREERRLIHEWGDVTVANAGCSCATTTCARCGTCEYVAHDWGPIEMSVSQLGCGTQVCSRCSKRQDVPHEYECKGGTISGTQEVCQCTYQCKRCGHTIEATFEGYCPQNL